MIPRKNAHLIHAEVENFLAKGAIKQTPPVREGLFSVDYS